MNKIIPCGHRVLVKLKTLKEEEEVSKGGIIIAKVNQSLREARARAMQEAYVVSLGQTAFKAFDDGEPWCKVGDLVLIVKYSGEDRIDPETNEIYRIINDEDICACLEEDK